MQKCSSCQAENEDKAASCFLCGQKLKKRGLLGRVFGGGSSEGQNDKADAGTYYSPPPSYDSGVELGQSRPPEAPPTRAAEPPPAKPEDAGAFKERGKEYLSQGQYQQAVDANSEAIQINPQFTDAYYNRGLAFILMGQYHRAIKDFDEAISLDGQDPDAFYNRGHALFMLHQLERAVADYDQAIQLDPNNGERYIGRGAAYFEQGAFQQSIDDFGRALGLGDYPHAYSNRAVSYLRLGKLAEAEEDIKLAQQSGYEPHEAIEELKKHR